MGVKKFLHPPFSPLLKLVESKSPWKMGLYHELKGQHSPRRSNDVGGVHFFLCVSKSLEILNPWKYS